MKRLLSSFLALAVCQAVCCYGKTSTNSGTEKLTDKQLEKLIKRLVGESDDDAAGDALVEKVKELDGDERNNLWKRSQDKSLQENGQMKAVRSGRIPRKDRGDAAKGTVALESRNDDGGLLQSADVQNARCPEGFFVGVDFDMGEVRAKNTKVHAKIRKKGEEKGTVFTDSVPSEFRLRKFCPVLSAGYTKLFENGFWLGIAGDFGFQKTSKRVKKNFYDGAGEGEGKINGNPYSLRSKFGYFIEDIGAVIYGMAGVKWMNVTFKWRSPVGISNSMKRSMPLLGVGFEKKIGEAVSMSCEYDCFWKKSSSYSVASNPSATDPDVEFLSVNHDSKLHGYSLKIGFKYYF